MARRSRNRRKQRERGAQSQALAKLSNVNVWRVSLQVQCLEMARGHDGLLRGMPEPTMILGVFALHQGQARLMGRFLYRFAAPPGFPCKVGPKERSDEAVAMMLPPGSRLAVLALAVEEDNGRGLATLFAALEQTDSIVAWTDYGVAPEPLPLPELCARGNGSEHGQRVHLMLGDRDPSRDLEGDDWIDASLLWFEPGPRRAVHRLHFVSGDGRNDWTAELEVGLRPA